MTFLWVHFDTHESHWVFNTVEEMMEVAPDVWQDDVLIVPIPYHFARARANGFCPDVTRYTKIPEVDIVHASFFNEALQVGFAQVWSIHAYRVLPDVHKRTHASKH